MTAQFNLDSYLRDPDAFLFKLDLFAQRALVVRLSDKDLRDAAFVDDRMLQVQRSAVWMSLGELLEPAEPLAPPLPGAIFHIGHCGSTLLSRMLQALPGVLAIREPLVLRTLADLRREPEATARLNPEQWERLFRRSLALLQRRARSNHLIVKATSSCNGLIAPWMGCDPAARGVLMHIDLHSYLCTMLKSPNSRYDAENFVASRLGDLQRLLEDSAVRLHQLNQAQRIALGWFAEMLRFERLKHNHGERLMRLDFADLLANSNAVLADVAKHLGVASTEQSIAAALKPNVLGRYAKATEHAYSPQDRIADLHTSADLYSAELASAMGFADELMQRYPALSELGIYLRTSA